MRSPEPEAHDKVLENNPVRIVICKCWFLRRGEVPGEKPPRARKRTNNKLNPQMTPGPGIKPRTHWWEANALTTAPSLLACMAGRRKEGKSK